MKGIVSIFVMPYEIHHALRLLTLLKRGIRELSEDVRLSLDLTFCLSPEILHEKPTVIQELEREFLRGITPLVQEFEERTIRVEKGREIIGCVSQRRNTFKEFPNMDFYIWIDPNLHFLPETLFYLTEGFRSLKEIHPSSPLVLVPQVPRLWDFTWDVLVHQRYKQEKFGYCFEIDPETVVQIDEEVSIEESPIHKFGGGWMTLLSREIMEEIGVPEELGHYGMEDTYIMWRMRERGFKQYILNGAVVAKNYVDRESKKRKKVLKLRDRKDEMRRYAELGFQKLFKNRE